MESEAKKQAIINAATSMEFHPCELTDSRKLQEYKRISMSEISGLGAAFSELVPQFRTVTKTTTINADGLWRCTFPRGVSGQLAHFKDGSGYVGSIINKGVAGQARWNPVNSVSASQMITVPVSPLNMFMAMTLVEMNHKLDDIQQIGEDILDYLKARDQAQQEADFEELVRVYNNYKFNVQDEEWKKAEYIEVQSIRRETSAKIKLLHGQIDKALNKHDPVHTTQQSEQMSREVQGDFQLYRLAVFMYAFSTYLEILLQGNFSKDYLDSVSKDINDRAVEYRKYYTECFNKLEHSSKTALGTKLLDGISRASSETGKAIHKIPVIEKGPLDEALIKAGKSVREYNYRQVDRSLEGFKENMRSGSSQFVKGIEEINHLYNDPMDVLIDRDNIYLRLV